MSSLVDFDIRNESKKKLHTKTHDVFFKERDIFFMSMGKNVRFEQNGKGADFSRPIVIIKKFNNDIFWWVPLSTKLKEWPYYFSFFASDQNQCAILSQLKLCDKNRLLKKIGTITESDFFLLKQKIKDLL